jgi:hypothetical protein
MAFVETARQCIVQNNIAGLRKAIVTNKYKDGTAIDEDGSMFADAIIELAKLSAETDPIDEELEAFSPYFKEFPEFKPANAYKCGPIAPIYQAIKSHPAADILKIRWAIGSLVQWCIDAFRNSSVTFFANLPDNILRDCAARMAADILEGLTLATHRTLRPATGQKGFYGQNAGAFLSAISRSFNVSHMKERLKQDIPKMQ